MKGSCLPNVIIGGTNKAGTTSVFRYLSDHPQVCGSKVKETGFFIRTPKKHIDSDVSDLGKYFDHWQPGQKIRVEASTGYLARGEVVIPRIQAILESPKIIFVLRSPADRLFSYYNFHVSRSSIPTTISFERFVDLSMSFDEQEMMAKELPIEERHLAALQHGIYSRYLKKYIDVFGVDLVKIMFFDDLQRDCEVFMRAISSFLAIDENFYGQYRFEIENETFFSRRQWLRSVAEFLNRILEPYLRQRPRAKRVLVRTYKKFNLEHRGYSSISNQVREKLESYYTPHFEELEQLLGMRVPETWR